MTEPDDTTNSTRPISVAELLARNGNIGSPPVTGRRRRHRGNADAVTVAELTGEIPIIGDIAPAKPHEETQADPSDEHQPEQVAEPVAVQHVHAEASAASAEQMSPDFIVDEEESASAADLASPDATEVPESIEALEDLDAPDSVPSYLRSTAGPLFSGQTVADDLARRGARAPLAADRDPAAVADADDAAPATREPHGEMSTFLRGVWIVVQSILAVAFGAGLFIAFDQLWKWNSIVALVLSVLVILGLVVGVRVVRKTEDIASTLIAVAVGALVTLGPLALLQSN